MRMKAAILIAQNQPLAIGDVEIPKLDVGQVLVRIAHSGVCGKQIEEINGRRGEDPYLPHLLGHEGSGEVIEVGAGVKKVKPGDHVVLHWIKSTGIDSNPPRYSWADTEVSAGWVTTFSEYTIASENRVTPITNDVSLEVAALLGCAVTTGLGIVFNNAGMTPGQSIAVFGTGGVGLNVIQGAALVNAYPIVAVDIVESKLELAAKFGATHFVNTSDSQDASQFFSLVGNQGFDVTVDVTGISAVRQMAYSVTSNVGRTVFAGVPNVNALINIDSFPLHFGRRVLGSHGGETRPDIDIPRYLQLYKLGKLKLLEQITHRYDLDHINDAIDVMKSGESGRCMISMN